MKSNICKINDGVKDLDAILKECEKFAEYNAFEKKQALHLRLLCEEIDGLLPNILGDFAGDFWIEYQDGVCKINVSIEFFDFSVEKKTELIKIAKNKKNSAVNGIVARIRSAIEDFFLDGGDVRDYEMLDNSYFAIENTDGVNYYSIIWNLKQHKKMVQQKKNEDDWDELEKSIIASIADDITVGVKGRRANIVIIKKFA